jgi:hypothetical protein
MKSYVKVSGILLRKITYSKGSRKKRISCKVSTTGILYLPNMYLINFHLILHSHFFNKDRSAYVLQCCNGRYRRVSIIVKTSISFGPECLHGTSWIPDVVS